MFTLRLGENEHDQSEMEVKNTEMKIDKRRLTIDD